jgi:hypothetical protein
MKEFFATQRLLLQGKHSWTIPRSSTTARQQSNKRTSMRCDAIMRCRPRISTNHASRKDHPSRSNGVSFRMIVSRWCVTENMFVHFICFEAPALARPNCTLSSFLLPIPRPCNFAAQKLTSTSNEAGGGILAHGNRYYRYLQEFQTPRKTNAGRSRCSSFS